MSSSLKDLISFFPALEELFEYATDDGVPVVVAFPDKPLIAAGNGLVDSYDPTSGFEIKYTSHCCESKVS